MFLKLLSLEVLSILPLHQQKSATNLYMFSQNDINMLIYFKYFFKIVGIFIIAQKKEI